jgi:hypothetical protein
LNGRRAQRHAVEPERRARVVHGLAAPERVDHLERLVEQGGAGPRVGGLAEP